MGHLVYCILCLFQNRASLSLLEGEDKDGASSTGEEKVSILLTIFALIQTDLLFYIQSREFDSFFI